jgi:hypothetical protein
MRILTAPGSAAGPAILGRKKREKGQTYRRSQRLRRKKGGLVYQVQFDYFYSENLPPYRPPRFPGTYEFLWVTDGWGFGDILPGIDKPPAR